MTALSQVETSQITRLYREVISRVNADESALLLLAHYGDFPPQKVDSIIRLVEASVIESGIKRASAKRFCNVLIECIQNISHHGARDQQGKLNAFISVSGSPGSNTLSCGNMILSQDLDTMKSRLEGLNALSKNEIRKQFIDTLCNEDFTNKGGAGLGLLTVAKKMEGPLGFELIRLDDNFAYLILNIRVAH